MQTHILSYKAVTNAVLNYLSITENKTFRMNFEDITDEDRWLYVCYEQGEDTKISCIKELCQNAWQRYLAATVSIHGGTIIESDQIQRTNDYIAALEIERTIIKHRLHLITAFRLQFVETQQLHELPEMIDKIMAFTDSEMLDKAKRYRNNH